MNFQHRPLFLPFTLVVIVFVIGFLGFYIIESQYSFLDALYMTVITISTVGYSEVVPLSSAGRLFALIFILLSIIVFAFAVKRIGEHLINNLTIENIKNKRNRKMIATLTKHTIVCGYGRNGRQAVERLRMHKQPYVVIEKNPDVVAEHLDDTLFLKGNAHLDEVLEKANISQALHLISALPNDVDNLFVVLSARQINPKITIVSRASEEATQRKLSLAGADHVVMPDKIGGDHMAALLMVPDLIKFVKALYWWGGDESPNLEEVAIDKVPEEFHHKTLAELDLRNKTGCNVVGYIYPSGKRIINPNYSLTIEPRAKLIVLGSPSALIRLNKMFQLD